MKAAYHKNSGTRIVSKLKIADTFLSRAIGLLLTKELKEEEGLLLIPCKSIHTWFMRYSIDIVFLGMNSDVIAVYEKMRPFRATKYHKNARSALELPSGILARKGIYLKNGDIIHITDENGEKGAHS